MESLPPDLLKKLYERYEPEFFKLPLMRKLYSNEDFVREHLRERPCGPQHVLASPLMEVISVTLFNKKQHDVSCEIYGSIRIEDGEGAIFVIYNRTVDKPQTICSGDPLILSMPKGRAITPSNIVKMEIALKDRTLKDSARNDVEIVTGSCIWDFKSFYEYDILKREEVECEHGSIAVDYIAYRHAVFVTVEAMLLDQKEVESWNSPFLHGSIVARCANKFSTTLFDKKEDESVRVDYGTCIELSRPVVVVPVGSSFVIDAKLWNRDTRQQIVGTKLDDFRMLYYGRYDRMRHNGLFLVQVGWSHAYMQTPVIGKSTENTTSSVDNIDNLLPTTKKHGVYLDPRSLLNPHIRRNLLSDLRKSLEIHNLLLLEVFSISVHNIDKEFNSDKEFKLWGSIKVVQSIVRGQFCMLDKTSPGAERLLPNQTVPIIYPDKCAVSSTTFQMDLDLKDVDGRKISHGRVWWYERLYETPIFWFDRKLCSVVRGDHGYYTAIHYSILRGGVQAEVKIHLMDKNSSMKYSKVYGCVCCGYSRYEYLTAYDKEFYKRKLFAGTIEDDSLLQFADSKILLSESWVSVPIGSALIIDINLNVISGIMDFLDDVKTKDMLKATECLEGQVTFSTAQKSEQKVIGDATLCHQIEVSVEWSEVPELEDE